MWKSFECLPLLFLLAGCGNGGMAVADSPYPITVLLDTAATDRRFSTPEMRYLYADLSSTGQAKIKFGSTSAQALTLIPGSNYPIVADDIFITYDAQAGKKLELLHSSSPIGGGGNRTSIDAPVSPRSYKHSASNSSSASYSETLVAKADNTKGIKILSGIIAVTVVTTAVAPVYAQASLYMFDVATSETEYVGLAIKTVTALNSTDHDIFVIPPIYIPPNMSLEYQDSRNVAGGFGGRSIVLNYEVLN